jgi:hypothetical protein
VRDSPDLRSAKMGLIPLRITTVIVTGANPPSVRIGFAEHSSSEREYSRLAQGRAAGALPTSRWCLGPCSAGSAACRQGGEGPGCSRGGWQPIPLLSPNRSCWRHVRFGQRSWLHASVCSRGRKWATEFRAVDHEYVCPGGSKRVEGKTAKGNTARGHSITESWQHGSPS